MRSRRRYFVRVSSAKISVMFFARMPAGELETFRDRFDKLAATLRLPD